MREGEAAANPRAPPTVSRARGCESHYKIPGTCENPGPRLGVVVLFPGTSRTFDLVTPPRPIPLWVCRTVPAVQAAAFERIDIAECASVRKVELDDIVAVVEWCARE